MDTSTSNNETIYAIFGLRRSGHHGVVRWLCGCLDDDVIWHDDCKVIGANIRGARHYKYSETPTNIVYNFESFGVRQFESVKKALAGKNVKYILILRDVYNWAASLRKYILNKGKLQPDLNINRWVDYAKEYLGETEHLPDVTTISYNHWMVDEAYRKEVTANLGIGFNDNGKDIMVSESSFSDMTFQNNASELPVLVRYREFDDDQVYRSLFSTAAKEYNEKIYKMAPVL